MIIFDCQFTLIAKIPIAECPIAACPIAECPIAKCLIAQLQSTRLLVTGVAALFHAKHPHEKYGFE